MKAKVAIIGSGNIGTDLMFKVLKLSQVLEMAVMVGIDAGSDGLKRARQLGIEVTSNGVEGLIASPQFGEVRVIFDATSAGAHQANAQRLLPFGKRLVDLTPAALGPYVIPAVNLEEHLDAPDINMVTCGGQATIPIIAAISSVIPVHYGEIVASIASKSAGPGTRANIDEFTETTSAAIEEVGGAARGRAIIVLNPAEPPTIMRDTIQVLTDLLTEDNRAAVIDAVAARVDAVSAYVPGYRLKQAVQFSDHGADFAQLVPPDRVRESYTQIAVFLEIEGASMYFPSYAGNLDIMTSAALRTAERLVHEPRNESTP